VAAVDQAQLLIVKLRQFSACDLQLRYKALAFTAYLRVIGESVTSIFKDELAFALDGGTVAGFSRIGVAVRTHPDL
jgi:hypothetical protein